MGRSRGFAGGFLMTMTPAWALEVLMGGIGMTGVGEWMLQEQVRRYREAEGRRPEPHQLVRRRGW